MEKVTTGTTKAQGDNIITQQITRPKELFLLFWINEDDKGEKMFSEASQTRLKNIKRASWYDENIHKVHCPPIQAFHEIKTIVSEWIDKYGGRDKVTVREVGVFSHSATLHGPICYDTPNIPPAPGWSIQMGISGGWDSIDFNWKSNCAMCVFYGCNSGHDIPEGFALRISQLKNFQNVAIWGQSASSFPSFEPNIRITTPARSMNTGWDVGQTYMVGGGPGEGSKAITGPHPNARFMNKFINGVKVGSNHQGVFNDHKSKVVS